MQLDQNRVRSVSALQTGNKTTPCSTGGCQKKSVVVAATHWPESLYAIGRVVPSTVQRHACGMRPPKGQFQRKVQARLIQRGFADRPCVVSDVSSNGAKIIVSGEATIPTHFELAFDLAGTRRTCELVWWHGKTAGVKFVR